MSIIVFAKEGGTGSSYKGVGGAVIHLYLQSLLPQFVDDSFTGVGLLTAYQWSYKRI